MLRGMTLLASLAGLAIASAMTVAWYNLWQHQQRLQQVQQWRSSLLQLQQAQRHFFRRQQRFAVNQDELVSSGLIAHRLPFAHTSAWRFEPQQNTLLMHADLSGFSPDLLLRDMTSYLWHAPQVTVKVIGYVAP